MVHQELGSTIYRTFKCKIVFLDCLQAVKCYFRQLGAKLDLSLEVSFQKDEIILDIREELETEEGWKITPISYPLVSLYLYRIVPSKRSWALAAQVSKIEGGQLHEE